MAQKFNYISTGAIVQKIMSCFSGSSFMHIKKLKLSNKKIKIKLYITDSNGKNPRALDGRTAHTYKEKLIKCEIGDDFKKVVAITEDKCTVYKITLKKRT